VSWDRRPAQVVAMAVPRAALLATFEHIASECQQPVACLAAPSRTLLPTLRQAGLRVPSRRPPVERRHSASVVSATVAGYGPRRQGRRPAQDDLVAVPGDPRRRPGPPGEHQIDGAGDQRDGAVRPRLERPVDRRPAAVPARTGAMLSCSVRGPVGLANVRENSVRSEYASTGRPPALAAASADASPGATRGCGRRRRACARGVAIGARSAATSSPRSGSQAALVGRRAGRQRPVGSRQQVKPAGTRGSIDNPDSGRPTGSYIRERRRGRGAV